MDDKTSAVLLAAAVLGVAAWGLVEVLRPGWVLNRGLLVTVVLVLVSLVVYRAVVRGSRR